MREKRAKKMMNWAKIVPSKASQKKILYYHFSPGKFLTVTLLKNTLSENQI